MPKSEKYRLVEQSVYSSFWKEGGFVLLGGVCVVWMDIWELRKSPTCLRRRLPFPLRLFFFYYFPSSLAFSLDFPPSPLFLLLSSFFLLFHHHYHWYGIFTTWVGACYSIFIFYFEGWILGVEGGGSWSLS